MKVIVDRFEGEYAVCEKEDKTMMDISINDFPTGVKEGDVLIITGDIISIDIGETAKRKENIKKLMDKLWE
jgi:hypothetical protein